MKKLLFLLSLLALIFVSACTNPASYTLVDKDNIAYKDIYLDDFKYTYNRKHNRVISESDTTPATGSGIVGTWFYESGTPSSSSWLVTFYTYSADGIYSYYYKSNTREIRHTGTYSLELQSNGLPSYRYTIGDENNYDTKLIKYMVKDNVFYTD